MAFEFKDSARADRVSVSYVPGSGVAAGGLAYAAGHRNWAEKRMTYKDQRVLSHDPKSVRITRKSAASRKLGSFRRFAFNTVLIAKCVGRYGSVQRSH